VARRSGLIVLSVLAVCVLALSAGSARALNSTYWCSAHPALDPCVLSATINSAPLAAGDANYDVWAIPSNNGSDHTVQWSIQPETASDLSAAAGDTFSITIKTSVVPRVIDSFAGSLDYSRAYVCGGPSGCHYEVTVTGTPVSVTDQLGCSYPPGGPTCSPVASAPSSVLFSGEINDYNYNNYSDPSYPAGLVDSFYGMTMATNITETGLPPNIIQSNGQNELQIDLADHHFLQNGTTVVHGNFYLVIPDTFLSTYWGINDPSTLATDGLNATVGAGAGTLNVTVVPGTGVQVAITGLTFSRRKLKIKLGLVTPRAPTHVKARRTSGTTARVTFRAARPRGQKVKGYSANCRALNKLHRLRVTGKHSPATIKGLTPGVAYRCTLEGRSRAGYGHASKRFSIPA